MSSKRFLVALVFILAFSFLNITQPTTRIKAENNGTLTIRKKGGKVIPVPWSATFLYKKQRGEGEHYFTVTEDGLVHDFKNTLVLEDLPFKKKRYQQGLWYESEDNYLYCFDESFKYFEYKPEAAVNVVDGVVKYERRIEEYLYTRYENHVFYTNEWIYTGADPDWKSHFIKEEECYWMHGWDFINYIEEHREEIERNRVWIDEHAGDFMCVRNYEDQIDRVEFHVDFGNGDGAMRHYEDYGVRHTTTPEGEEIILEGTYYVNEDIALSKKESEREFDFKINFYTDFIYPLPETFPVTIKLPSGETRESTISSKEGTFKLPADAEIIIKDLPYGTRYYISENVIPESDGFERQTSGVDGIIWYDSLNPEVTFLNKPIRGSLSITKQVEQEEQENFKIRISGLEDGLDANITKIDCP